MRSRLFLNLTASCGLAMVLSGCGTDVVRFSETPVPNPFGDSARFDPKTTASLSSNKQATPSATTDIVPAPAGSSSSAVIASAPLEPPLEAGQSPTPTATTTPATASLATVQGTAPAPAKAATAEPVQEPLVLAPNAKPYDVPGGKWVPNGGSPLTLKPGETLASLSDRYGAPEAAIRSANGLKPKDKVLAGSKLIIPVFVADASAPAKPGKAAPQVAAVVPNTLAPSSTLTGAAPLKTAAPQTATATPAPKQVASVEPAEAALAKTDVPVDAAAGKAISTTGFRWPAHGKIILGYGDKNGVKSNGINISLPQGTPVKAAEAGTVAYADEVKGFGNLVMVRHPDGWVTVYANNSELKVKRGDTIKRGQVVALSGQSGDVTSPQLHFEIRKGSSPVDPVEHLSDD